jgi:maltose O-acetyltransferase
VRVEGSGRVVFGRGVAFGGANGSNRINVGPGATVSIGDRAYLNGVTIDATTDVVIGADCVIGQAWITTTNFHRADPTTRNEPATARPVVLQDNVWLANRATVLPGTTVGANSVVSVGTVVGEDVPADVVVSSHGLHVVKKLS